MRVFILGADLAVQQPVWINMFWPQYRAIAETVPVTFLGVPNDRRLQQRRLQWFSLQWRHRSLGSEWCAKVTDNLDKSGPNILLVWALNRADIQLVNLLNPVRSAFDHTVLSIHENIIPDRWTAEQIKKFDVVMSFCGDIAKHIEQETGVKSLFAPPHTDVLNYHSTSDFRPIDLILVGRRNKALHRHLHPHFNSPDRDRLFLDFVTRTQMATTPEEEFGLLMTTYSRSKAAICFDASDIDRFQGRSPLTARWVHAWAAGCTVIGSKPTGLGVAEQMDWPESTIDIGTDPARAIEQVEAVLEDDAGLRRRRRRNAAEALRRHDTRLRLKDLFSALGLPLPQTLEEKLDLLVKRADAVENSP